MFEHAMTYKARQGVRLRHSFMPNFRSDQNAPQMPHNFLLAKGLSTIQGRMHRIDDEPKNIFDDAARWMYLHIMRQKDRILTAYQPALPCACATLRRATRAVTQIYNAALRETGLEITQF